MKKKILFYYPRTSGEDDSKSLYVGLPLSVLTLVAQIDHLNYDVKIVDGRLDDWRNLEIDTWLKDENVLFVGISAMTSYQIKDGLDLAGFVRKINPNILLAWGGWHPSLMPAQTLEHELVDLIVIGQGEETILKLVNQLESKGDLSMISNLAYKDKLTGQIIYTSVEPLKMFSAVKSINLSLKYIEPKRYIQSLWGHQRVLGYESSRGCPWKCNFCSIGSVYKRAWNALPAERVANEIEYLVHEHTLDAIHFFDNNFFVNPQRAHDIASLFIQKNLNIHWDGTAIVEQFLRFSPEYIEHLKESGFFRIIVGVESGDEDVLKLLDKRHRNEQVLQMIKKCAQHGVLPSLSFIVGFPLNPEKDLRETIALIEQIKAIEPKTEILLFIFTPYLGTPLYDLAVEHGMVFPQNFENWAYYTYEKVNVPWIDQKLSRKINRYISFFGTKDMSSEVLNFYKMES